MEENASPDSGFILVALFAVGGAVVWLRWRQRAAGTAATTVDAAKISTPAGIPT